MTNICSSKQHKSHLHLAWMGPTVRQVSLVLEYHKMKMFAKYHLVDASVYNQPHSLAAAISCSASHNESHISLKILCLLKYAVLKVILRATKVKGANGRSEMITPIFEILVKLCGSWPPRCCYCIKNNWFTLMEKWYSKVKPHMEIRIFRAGIVLHEAPLLWKATPCIFLPVDPRSKCLSQRRNWTTMCYHSDFHSRDTFLIKVKGGAFHARSAYYGTKTF